MLRRLLSLRLSGLSGLHERLQLLQHSRLLGKQRGVLLDSAQLLRKGGVGRQLGLEHGKLCTETARLRLHRSCSRGLIVLLLRWLLRGSLLRLTA